MTATNLDPRVPTALRRWFVVHCVVYLLVAVPLLVAPVAFLEWLGWRSVDPFTARIAAAALFGVGLESWLGRRGTAETFRAMLNLKVIWSAACALGIGLSLLEGAQGRPLMAWAFLGVFVAFHALWLGYRLSLARRDPQPVLT